MHIIDHIDHIAKSTSFYTVPVAVSILVSVSVSVSVSVPVAVSILVSVFVSVLCRLVSASMIWSDWSS